MRKVAHAQETSFHKKARSFSTFGIHVPLDCASLISLALPILWAACVQKNPRVRKMFCPEFWGWKWLRQVYGRLEKLRSFCRNTDMPKKSSFWGGGVILGFWGGWGSADFIFMGARILLMCANTQEFSISPRACTQPEANVQKASAQVRKNFRLI